METTNLLELPYIASAQAQKHVTHNEALKVLDALVQLSVTSRTVTEPPNTPANGDRYIVPTGAMGVWQGKDAQIAAFNDGAWGFHSPKIGWQAYCEDEQVGVVWADAQWRPLSANADLTDIQELGINTSPDALNRLAVKSDAVLLSHDDVTPGSGDIRLNLNKAQSADTATALFQSGFSGRAELGLAGNDDFSLKVSEDGQNWTEAVRIDRKSGGVSMSFFDSQQFEVGFEQAAMITPPTLGGIMFLSIVSATVPQNQTAAIFAYDTGASLQLTSMFLGPRVSNQGATPLTGTAGPADKISVAVDDTGNIHIENRFVGGVTRQFCTTFINGYRQL